jgi:hypothetical protein
MSCLTGVDQRDRVATPGQELDQRDVAVDSRLHPDQHLSLVDARLATFDDPNTPRGNSLRKPSGAAQTALSESLYR